MLAIVTGLIATYPLGGIGWHYGQYLLGLRRLGWDVVYLEDTGRWCYDPEAGTWIEDAAAHVARLERIVDRWGLAGRWAFRDTAGRLHGLDETELDAALDACEVFLNVSGSCWLRPRYRACRRTVYIDTDPGFDQTRIAAVEAGSDDEDLRYSVERIAEHDHHFTFGESVGRSDCGVPPGAFRWRPTRQPVVLDRWPSPPLPAGAPYTTVLSWRAYEEPLEYRGHRYRGKEDGLRAILDLPSRVACALELAIAGEAPLEELRAHGWRVIDALEISDGMDTYRDYVTGSRGELSVAKDLYVDLRTGWFSERSACYLAAGRPVILEDTGYSDHLPTGKGLHAFSSLEEAVEAVERVEADRENESKAARDVAARCFDSDRVLGELLAEVGL